MSAGPSLYRRHRPRTFADVVGQEHVVRTLSNAVEQGKVHHAYLFVGSRGTGKTSMAKILAACLNCVNGPTIEPCGVCDACVAIQNATSLDVIEMDAASHNSVDDIRELRDKVAFAPISGGTKVYILDEAHMLTSQAWNAFLKTLEEPPPGTIFVLATTEAQKVLPTVVDRCHRFDFGRPTVEQLASVLQRVAGEEQIEIAPDALALLARHATGSFRDALGTLEQLVTYSATNITVGDVQAVLGAVDDDLLFGTLDAVASHDAAAALRAAAQVAGTGRDLVAGMRDIEAHTRELLVVRTLGAVPAELRVTPERDARLSDQAERLAATDLVLLLELLGTSLRAVKDGADARTRLELALVQAATPEVDASTKALLTRIARLEAALQGAASAPIAPLTAVPDVAATPAAAPLQSVPREDPPPAPAQPTAVAAAPAPTAEEALASPHVPAAEPIPPVAPPPAPAPTRASVTLEEVHEVWPAALETVGADYALLEAALSNARPVEIVDGTLILAFAANDTFNRRMAAENQEHRRSLGEALLALTGAQLRLAYEHRDLGEPERPPELAGDELVARIVKEFDAEEIVPEPEPQGPA